MPGYNSQRRGTAPHSSTLVVICVVRLLFVLFYVLFVCKCVLPSGDNPTAVNKYIISSPSGRNVNYDEKQLAERGGGGIFELFLLSVQLS